ncbi:hypothetical protein FRC17_010542 [Serendipita sp. 399]|nr:hypothetical protein FRC17_010542 [Serendipita sp. 399]
MRDEIAPNGWLRYAPDSHFVLTSYAVLSLLKASMNPSSLTGSIDSFQQLVRPEFRAFMDNESKILSLVHDMAETLQAVAVNKYHTPYLYSVFLRALLASKMDGSRPSSPRPVTSPGPVISANEPMMVPNTTSNPMMPSSTHFSAGPESPTRNAFGANDMFGLDMYRSLGENYGDMSNFVNPFDMNSGQPPLSADFSAYNQVGQTPNADSNAPISLDSLLTNGFWDSMLVPGFSNTLEGMSGGFIYGPGGSGYISKWHSPAGSRRQTPKGENRALPGGMTPLEVS